MRSRHLSGLHNTLGFKVSTKHNGSSRWRETPENPQTIHFLTPNTLFLRSNVHAHNASDLRDTGLASLFKTAYDFPEAHPTLKRLVSSIPRIAHLSTASLTYTHQQAHPPSQVEYTSSRRR
jgi:hypothetical protein